jgi:hypothetical protein
VCFLLSLECDSLPITCDNCIYSASSGNMLLCFTQESEVDLHSSGRVLKPRDDGRGQTYTRRSCQKYDSLSLYDFLSIGRHLLGVSSIRSLKSNLCSALSTQNTTENNCVIVNHITRIHFSPMYFQLVYMGHWSQLKPLATSTAKSPVSISIKGFKNLIDIFMTFETFVNIFEPSDHQL